MTWQAPNRKAHWAGIRWMPGSTAARARLSAIEQNLPRVADFAQVRAGEHRQAFHISRGVQVHGESVEIAVSDPCCEDEPLRNVRRSIIISPLVVTDAV